MTKSTLKTLWLTGGGLVATWFAGELATTPRNTSQTAPPERPAAIHETMADELTAQEARLRRQPAVQLKPSSRNPFRFAAKQSEPTTMPPQRSAAAAPVAPAPVQPSLSLSGIAERKTPQGTVRTAIISGDGQLYLVAEGEMVAGRYRVIAVDSDAVTLRDESGGEIRLVLH